MDGLYLPPKPAVIVRKPADIVKPGDPRFSIPPEFSLGALAGIGAARGSGAGITTQIAQGTGTAIGNMTSNGGLAASFDGTTSQAQAACSYLANAAAGTVGKDWGVGVTKTITQVKVYASTNSGFNNDVDSPILLDIEGSTDNFAASIVLLKSDASILASAASANNAIVTITGLDVSTAYRYHRLKMTRTSGSIWALCAELQFFEDI